MNEEWKKVTENDRYEISSSGRVRTSAGRILNPAPRKNDGYVMVDLSLGKRKLRLSRLVHVLVAKEFIPNPDNLPVVNHINGIHYDNRRTNLEWVSVKGNRNKWKPGAKPG